VTTMDRVLQLMAEKGMQAVTPQQQEEGETR
jgi:hypothetical protein